MLTEIILQTFNTYSTGGKKIDWNSLNHYL